MRSFVPGYELRQPQTLSDALERMAGEPGEWKPFAGGTDLMVLLEAGKLVYRKFLNIWKLQELRGITVSPEFVTLNSLTTYTDIRHHELLAREFPLLCRAAAETGSIATQNRGTLGGNIANASPAADSPPALLVYDADLELVSASGARWVPYQGFWKGYKQIAMRKDELIRAIRLPRKNNFSRQFSRKVGTRRAQAISKVCFAGAARMDAGRIVEVRIALGSVAPTVLRATATEAILRGEKPVLATLRAAQRTLAGEIAPIDDIRSTARYRLRVAQNLLAEFCESLAG
ncbi:MAG TPA: xanthine dehydrogenase family protein subunit M [Candidatus Acidoferrum sp.]|nr:xanthine dehydrogenase family protein subunit M [Candidatus Acidoferrum sp.]